MPSTFQRAILKTIVYSDIFDYPLTSKEMGRWFIATKNKEQITKNKLREIKSIREKNGFYFLRRREEIVEIRKKREKYSEEKIKIAQDIISLLKYIPFIKLIGITGALAVDNGKEKDDIDLFIVTSAGLLWTTRFLTTLLVEITGMRRHPGGNNIDNKICLNMFADENYLQIPKKEQDLFSAHEVSQMKPLYDKNHTCQKFLSANQWVKKYLPNATKSIKHKVLSIKYEKKKENLIEKVLKQFQLWYMRNRKTTEVINEGVIRFHPHDARIWVMRKYKEKLKEFNS